MENYERYGDYNDGEELEEQPHSPIGLIIKILCAIVCILTLSLLGYRIYLSEHTPSEIRDIAFTDDLLAYYEATEGNIDAKTQTLRFSYDDEKRGTFFADHLIVIEGIDQLQITLRYNVSTLSYLEEKYKVKDLDPNTSTYLSFRLTDNYGRVYDEVAYRADGSLAMYRFVKLAFSEVDLTPEHNTPEWIRLEILFDGQTDPYSYILIYENNDKYSGLEEYRLSGGERP
jgi:hypothetical protein